jgi:hypothetical protein
MVGDRFSVAATLQGGAWLAALTGCDLKKGLQSSDKRSMSESHWKIVPNSLERYIGDILSGFHPKNQIASIVFTRQEKGGA